MDEKKRSEELNESARCLKSCWSENPERRLHWTTIASEKALLALIGAPKADPCS